MRYVLIGVALICWITSAWAQQTRIPIAAIIKTNGTAEWRENADAEWKPAERALKLYEGNELKTHELSRAMIVFVATAPIVSINENSELVVRSTEIDSTEKKDEIDLRFGEVHLRISKDKKFEIETPNAVISTCGTKFDVSHVEGKTTLVVISGTVQLISKKTKATKEATAGMQIVVDKDGNITINSDDVDKAVEWQAE